MHKPIDNAHYYIFYIYTVSLYINTNLLIVLQTHRTFGTTELNFASWMAFNIPGVIINLFFAWLWIQFLFIGFSDKRYYIVAYSYTHNL